MTRLLVVDDDRLMRAGLIELLGADPSIEIVGEAGTGHRAAELARLLTPDVVLMDIRMPDGDGIAATAAITSGLADVRVLVLTTFDHDEYVFDALAAGASGFLLKRARPEELIDAVHVVARGEALLAPEVTGRVIARAAHAVTTPRDDHAVAGLTAREREVLDAMARGLSNREIAAELVVEESTVRTHVKRVLMKLGLRDRVHAVIFAYEHGLRPT